MPAPVASPTEIGLLLYPGCMPAGLFAAADLFHAANLRAGRPLFRLQWVALQPGEVPCAHGTRLHAEVGLADAGCKALLLPGFWAQQAGQLPTGLADNRELLRALRGLGRRVALWSYCTGVAFAAEVGRLDGQPATAAWWMAPWLAERYPKVDWQWQHACVVQPQQATAAGVHGYLPIVSAQVERWLSAEGWRDVARLMVLPRPRPAAPVFEGLAMTPEAPAWLRRLRAAVERLPANEATLDRLAHELGLSARTLARHVQAATGGPVGALVRRIKLHQAAERLLHADQSVGQVSAALGFSDESSFRRSFKAVTGVTPTAYRDLHAG